MLTTIGEACRAVKGELVAQLVDWIIDKLADDHWSVPKSKLSWPKPNVDTGGELVGRSLTVILRRPSQRKTWVL